MLRTTLVLMAVAIALAGCGDDDESETTAPATDSAATTTAEEASPLEGTWSTKPVTAAEMAETVREAGFGKFADDFEKNQPLISDAPTTLILDVQGGDWNLYGQAEGGGRKPIDYDAEYAVKADTVVVIHADGSRTLGWSINGNVLELTSLQDNLASYKGIPDEVFQTALYTTADFQRTP